MATDFGSMLRIARTGRNMSQQQLAAAAGTTQAQIARWELGERSPRLADMERLADALELDLNVWLAERDEAQGTTP